MSAITAFWAIAPAVPGSSGGPTRGKGGGCTAGPSGGGNGGTKGDTPGKGGGVAPAAESGKTTLGYFPSKLGSSARMRSIKGGCVAKPKNRLFNPFAKKKWLASSARLDWSCEPS